jgi:hypothetical protein
MDPAVKEYRELAEDVKKVMKKYGIRGEGNE